MSCKICRSVKHIDILKQLDTPIWSGYIGKSRGESFLCILKQCTTYGKIFFWA